MSADAFDKFFVKPNGICILDDACLCSVAVRHTLFGDTVVITDVFCIPRLNHCGNCVHI